jgi:PTH1 family peptidyl-tRNA hydrolase
MNLSGQSAQGLLNFYKIPVENMLIAHDDLDIPFGTIRIRPKGGPGGQGGMASTISQLGTKDFPRLRIGIGEMKVLSEIVDRAADAALEFVKNGLDAAMNKYNGSIEL